jgi:hypothetical protein
MCSDCSVRTETAKDEERICVRAVSNGTEGLRLCIIVVIVVIISFFLLLFHFFVILFFILQFCI